MWCVIRANQADQYTAGGRRELPGRDQTTVDLVWKNGAAQLLRRQRRERETSEISEEA